MESLNLKLLLKTKGRKIPNKLIIFSGIFASFATLPYVWIIFPWLLYGNYAAYLAVAEAFAVIVESAFYRMLLKLSLKDSFLISLACNSASFVLGLALFLSWGSLF